jgi:MarR family transcriptional regulator, lower aerobic nicotinate degradation pathway regulator
VLDGIRRIVQFLRLSATAAHRAVGLSGAQLFVLQKLADGPVPSVNELARRTLTHQSSVSVVVRRLEARRLVVRARGGDDGRRVEVRLTRRGRDSLRRAPEASPGQLMAAIERLPPKERRMLAKGLAGLLRGLGLAAVDRAPMFFED